MSAFTCARSLFLATTIFSISATVGRADQSEYARHAGDGQIIHQLFAKHDLMRREVEEIPGGIKAITVSDDPTVAEIETSIDPELTEIIRAHAREVSSHVKNGHPRHR